MVLDKLRKIGVLILIAFILGLFRVFLVYTPSGNNIRSLLNIKWYYYILILIFTFYLTLTIHELGHLLSFVVNKVKIKALYLTIFVFVKIENKWKFKIYLPLWKLLGGLVVPNLDPITNDEEYNDTKKKFIKSLKTAPIVTYSYFGLAIIMIIIMSFFSKASFLMSFLYIHFIFVIPLSVIYILSFKLNTNNMYGDLVAIKKIKEDEIFTYSQLYQYASFSSFENKKMNKYFYDKAIDILKGERNYYNFFTKNVLLIYLTKVIEENYETNDLIHRNILKTNFLSFKKDELTYTLIHALIAYYYNNNEVVRAYEMFFTVKNTKISLDEKLINYMNNKTGHLINYENNDIFLNNDENIYIGDYWIFKPLFPNLYEDLKQTHKKLDYKPYVCEVYSEIK